MSWLRHKPNSVRRRGETLEEPREMVGKIEVPTVSEARVDGEEFVDELRTNAEMLVNKVRDLLARIEIPTAVGAVVPPIRNPSYTTPGDATLPHIAAVAHVGSGRTASCEVAWVGSVSQR